MPGLQIACPLQQNMMREVGTGGLSGLLAASCFLTGFKGVIGGLLTPINPEIFFVVHLSISVYWKSELMRRLTNTGCPDRCGLRNVALTGMFLDFKRSQRGPWDPKDGRKLLLGKKHTICGLNGEPRG